MSPEHQFSIDLTDVYMLLIGASYRILACIRDDELDLLSDLFLVVDRRLQLECVFTWEKQQSLEDKIRMAEISSEVSSCGFIARHTETNLSNSFIIIDDTAVVFTEGAIQHFVSEEPTHVTPCIALFERVNNLTAICEELFLDNELILQPEETDLDFKERIKPRIETLDHLNTELFAHLAESPKDLYQLNPRKFEEVVARLTERLGYEIELTPISGDGGRDIIARRKDWTGHELLFIECKRYSPVRPVQVGIVRSFYGVLGHEEASRGLIVTTSYFSKGAIAFAHSHRNKIHLNDYKHLVGQLRQFANQQP